MIQNLLHHILMWQSPQSKIKRIKKTRGIEKKVLKEKKIDCYLNYWQQRHQYLKKKKKKNWNHDISKVIYYNYNKKNYFANTCIQPKPLYCSWQLLYW